jgi:hypothetical protein
MHTCHTFQQRPTRTSQCYWQLIHIKPTWTNTFTKLAFDIALSANRFIVTYRFDHAPMQLTKYNRYSRTKTAMTLDETVLGKCREAFRDWLHALDTQSFSKSANDSHRLHYRQRSSALASGLFTSQAKNSNYCACASGAVVSQSG